MHDYVYGAGLALEQIAKAVLCLQKAVCEEKKYTATYGLNLLGVTPLDFGAYSRAGYMEKKIWKNVAGRCYQPGRWKMILKY